jgi:hypothetical protein
MRINEAKSLLHATYVDWSQSNALANPRGIRKGSQITWDNYIPRVLKPPIMASDVIDLTNAGQYTFQMTTDGSLIQIYYQYDSKGNELQSACLAFYSISSYEDDELTNSSYYQAEKTLNDIDTTDEDMNSEEIFDEALDQIQLSPLRNNPISWLRIDYDPEHAKGVLHHDCHMHISAFPHARLAVAGVPTPKQFVEFVIALCYPKIYEEHRLNSKGQYTNENQILTINSDCVPLRDHTVFRQMAHLRIPIISEGHGR